MIFFTEPTIFYFVVFFHVRFCKAVLDYSAVGSEDSLFLKSKKEVRVYKDNPTTGWGVSFSTSNEATCPASCHRYTQCWSATYLKDSNVCELQDINRLSPNANVLIETSQQSVKFYEKRKPPINRILQPYVQGAYDCKDIYDQGFRLNGVYFVGDGDAKKTILCEMEMAGGGWTVIQQRFDASVSFEKNWVDYKHGFGSLAGSFWIGNDRIHNLTKSADNNAILFHLEKSGAKYYPAYQTFTVGDENTDYLMTIGAYLNVGLGEFSYTGSAFWNQDGMKFSTMDVDNDVDDDRFCSQIFGNAGWWFNACYETNLNGRYGVDKRDVGINWTPITKEDGIHYPFDYTRMLIRRM